MKILIPLVVVILAIFALFYSLNEGRINMKVAEIRGHSETCIDGVKYLQFPSGATVKYNKDGRIALCE